MNRAVRLPLNRLKYGWPFAKSRLAFWRAHSRLSGPAKQMNRFGVRMGLRSLMWDRSIALRYLLAPLEGTRYFELPFFWENVRSENGECLDLSSPRLASLFLAKARPGCSITMLNPDPEDLAVTEGLKDRLHLPAITTHPGGADSVPAMGRKFDSIWSISVLEHIAGQYDDTQTVQWLYEALRPGGQLILTVPTDRTAWVEYRSEDCYGQQGENLDGEYFFQRFYDLQAIRRRIIEPTGSEPAIMKWIGEKEPGCFHTHTKRLMSEGLLGYTEEPLEMTKNYREFQSWERMPGVGVCCMLLRKPGTGRCTDA